MSAHYQLVIKIIAAKELKNVNWRYGELKPFARVWVEAGTKCSTYAAAGDTFDGWNQKLIIPISTPIQESTLYIEIIHDEAADDVRALIGKAQITLPELFCSGMSARRSLQLLRPTDRPQGSLVIVASFCELGEDVNDDDFDCDPMEMD